MADEKGTGKHPHKSAEEPYSHQNAEHGKSTQGSHSSSGSHSSKGEGSKGKESESSDLKEREYRDEQGNVHHHTRTAGSHGEKQK